MQEERGTTRPAGESNEHPAPITFTASDIEGALWGLKSLLDSLVACEEAETRVPPIAVGVVLEVLLQDLMREGLSVCDDAMMR